MAKKFYTKRQHDIAGPLSPDKMKALAKDGRIKPNTRVSIDKRTWVPASKVKGLFAAREETQTHGVGRLKKRVGSTGNDSSIRRALSTSQLKEAREKAVASVSARQFQASEGAKIIDRLLNFPYVKVACGAFAIIVVVIIGYNIMAFTNMSSEDDVLAKWRKFSGSGKDFALPTLGKNWSLVKLEPKPITGIRRIAYCVNDRTLDISLTISGRRVAGMNLVLVQFVPQGDGWEKKVLKYRKASEGVEMLRGREADLAVKQETVYASIDLPDGISHPTGTRISIAAYVNLLPVNSKDNVPRLFTYKAAFVVGEGKTIHDM
jgi:hypothetical protein